MFIHRLVHLHSGIAPAATGPKPIHCAIEPQPVNVGAAANKSNHNKNTLNNGTGATKKADAKPAAVAAAVPVAAAVAVIKNPVNNKPNVIAKAAARYGALMVEPVPPPQAALQAHVLVPSVDTSIRTRRLMKELGDIQRMMAKPRPVFTVSTKLWQRY